MYSYKHDSMCPWWIKSLWKKSRFYIGYAYMFGSFLILFFLCMCSVCCVIRNLIDFITFYRQNNGRKLWIAYYWIVIGTPRLKRRLGGDYVAVKLTLVSRCHHRNFWYDKLGNPLGKQSRQVRKSQVYKESRLY